MLVGSAHRLFCTGNQVLVGSADILIIMFLCVSVFKPVLSIFSFFCVALAHGLTRTYELEQQEDVIQV